MGKGIGTNDGLVGLNHHAREVGHQSRGLGEFLGANRREGSGTVLIAAEKRIEVTTAHVQSHHQFLE